MKLDVIKLDSGRAGSIELADEVFGHLLPSGLVLFELLVPKGRPRWIKGHGDELWSLFFEDPAQGHSEAIGRACRTTIGVCEARAGHRKVRAISEGCPIEKEDARHS